MSITPSIKCVTCGVNSNGDEVLIEINPSTGAVIEEIVLKNYVSFTVEYAIALVHPGTENIVVSINDDPDFASGSDIGFDKNYNKIWENSNYNFGYASGRPAVDENYFYAGSSKYLRALDPTDGTIAFEDYKSKNLRDGVQINNDGDILYVLNDENELYKASTSDCTDITSTTTTNLDETEGLSVVGGRAFIRGYGVVEIRDSSTLSFIDSHTPVSSYNGRDISLVEGDKHGGYAIADAVPTDNTKYVYVRRLDLSGNKTWEKKLDVTSNYDSTVKVRWSGIEGEGDYHLIRPYNGGSDAGTGDDIRIGVYEDDSSNPEIYNRTTSYTQDSTTYSLLVDVRDMKPNRTPNASLSVTNPTNTFEVKADASGTTDADGDSLSYEYRWGDGNITTGATNSETHTYSSAGNYTVLVLADDGTEVGWDVDDAKPVLNKISTKDNDVWKTPSGVYVNDGGTWKKPDEVHVNDGGTWKKVLEVPGDVSEVEVNKFSWENLSSSPWSFNIKPNVTVESKNTSESTDGSNVLNINMGTSKLYTETIGGSYIFEDSKDSYLLSKITLDLRLKFLSSSEEDNGIAMEFLNRNGQRELIFYWGYLYTDGSYSTFLSVDSSSFDRIDYYTISSMDTWTPFVFNFDWSNNEFSYSVDGNEKSVSDSNLSLGESENISHFKIWNFKEGNTYINAISAYNYLLGEGRFHCWLDNMRLHSNVS